MSAKEKLKPFCPPILWDGLRNIWQPKAFSGPYSSYEEALANCSGYDHQAIFDKVTHAALMMRDNQDIFYRDGVLFKKPTWSYEILSFLLLHALQYGGINIIDIGGGMAPKYFEFKRFAQSIKLPITWSIIEQPHFVSWASDHLINDELKFYSSLEECISAHNPSFALLSNSLQYFPNPHMMLSNIIDMPSIDKILIDDMRISIRSDDVLFIEHVPNHIYHASYPMWVFTHKIIDTLRDRSLHKTISQIDRHSCELLDNVEVIRLFLDKEKR